MTTMNLLKNKQLTRTKGGQMCLTSLPQACPNPQTQKVAQWLAEAPEGAWTVVGDAIYRL